MLLHRAFDNLSQVLRFSVTLEHGPVTAYLSQSVWQARHGLCHSDSSFVEIYMANQSMIDAAVVRKVQAGARMPVVLNVADL